MEEQHINLACNTVSTNIFGTIASVLPAVTTQKIHPHTLDFIIAVFCSLKKVSQSMNHV